jgi:hypothetical protein
MLAGWPWPLYSLVRTTVRKAVARGIEAALVAVARARRAVAMVNFILMVGGG